MVLRVREWVRRKEVDRVKWWREMSDRFSVVKTKSFNLPFGCVRDCVGLCQNPSNSFSKNWRVGERSAGDIHKKLKGKKSVFN